MEWASAPAQLRLTALNRREKPRPRCRETPPLPVQRAVHACVRRLIPIGGREQLSSWVGPAGIEPTTSTV